jgi:hypothetical protein
MVCFPSMVVMRGLPQRFTSSRLSEPLSGSGKTKSREVVDLKHDRILVFMLFYFYD